MKKCLIVINIYKPDAARLAGCIGSYLQTCNISSDIHEFSGAGAGTAPVAENGWPFRGHDFVVTLGGDGTVLFAARGCAALHIPVFPVNLGEFGFIAGIQKDEWKQELDLFLSGQALLSERSMVEACVVRDGETVFTSPALNDFVIAATGAARLVMLDVFWNDVQFGRYKADGIIVATATGSTAYSAAAGGPIIDASLDALVLSPLCAFSLSNRPVVLSPDGILTIEVLPSRGAEIMLTADGQITEAVRIGDHIRIRKYPEKALLIGCSSEKFYGALRSKLNWSGIPGCQETAAGATHA